MNNTLFSVTNLKIINRLKGLSKLLKETIYENQNSNNYFKVLIQKSIRFQILFMDKIYQTTTDCQSNYRVYVFCLRHCYHVQFPLAE